MIKQTVEKIKNREISALEVAQGYLKNIDKKNGDINAYLEVFDDIEEQVKNIKTGALSGIPFAIKDNILIKGKKCSAGSKILENYRAPYDATVIKKLREAGAIFLGRTNMDEFAMGSSTENSASGVTKNPHNPERVPGGSSGGSAAAVAMGGCAAALGSDTAGSIRQPAGFCGVVGLSPTYGAVSRYGLMAMGSSFDQIGPITKTVEDAEIIFDVIKGKDKMDSTSVGNSVSDKKPSFQQRLKIGLLKYDRSGVDDEVNKTLDESVEKLREFGHKIREITLPNIDYSVPCYYILIFAEISANLARFDGVRFGISKRGGNLLEDYMETRAQGFGKEVKRRIMLGTYVLSAGYYDAYYGHAQKVRALIRKDFEGVFSEVDAIILPTSPTPAFKIGEKTENPLQMYLEDIFTAPAKLAGAPAISIPAHAKALAGKPAGLPIGIQLIAPWFREDVLFNLGKEIQL